MNTQHFYSHGKLLLTGEYVVLDGAKALALPCKFGQHLKVSPSEDSLSHWRSYDYKNNLWLKVEFENTKIISGEIEGATGIEQRLFQILKEIHHLNPDILQQNYQFETHLEFPQNWGLGTSSTLISNLAKWGAVDPYELLAKTFGGSGYDLACADADTALVYQIHNKTPNIQATHIPDAIIPYLYFVHLEQKQNSRAAIENYRRTKPNDLHDYLSKINIITAEFQSLRSIEKAHELMTQHENYLSELLNIPPVKSKLFSDFGGSIKSLGAWGGDFVMVVSTTDPSSYFKNKGYKTILAYNEMSL